MHTMLKMNEDFSDERPSLATDSGLASGRTVIPYNVMSSFDVFIRNVAKKLHENGNLYAVYGALDGLSNAYSSLKYLFDVIYTNSPISSTDALHEWMVSPEGMLFAGFSTTVLIAYSAMGNYFTDSSDSLLKRWIAKSWPYVRDCIKGTKNAYKGLRATLQVSTVLSGISFKTILVPSALVLGLFAVGNRLLLRTMYSDRKFIMRNNKELLLSIQSNAITPMQAKENCAQLKQQASITKKLAYVGATFGGLVDGMYMFMGVLGFALGAVSFPVLIYLTCCSLLYLSACIATRALDESLYQLKVDVSVAKAKLAIAGKLTAYYFKQYTDLLQKLPENPELRSDAEKKKLARLEANALMQLEEFNSLQQQLSNYQTLSWGKAFLLGVRHGMSAYSALTSLMFAAATVMIFCSVSLPAWVLIAVVTTGLLLLTAFIVHASYRAYNNRKQSQQLDEETKGTIADLRNTFANNQKTVKALEAEELQTKLFNRMTVDPSPQFFFQEWFEVLRSFFSGIGKGSKSIDYTLTAYQEVGADGHYHHDNIVMLCLSGASSLLFSLCLALRALCKGFGRPPVDDVPNPKEKNSQPPENLVLSEKKKQHTTIQSKDVSPPTKCRSNSAYSFFAAITPSDTKSRSQSKSSLLNLSRSQEIDTGCQPFAP